MVDFSKTLPSWEVSSRTFLPEGSRIEGCQSLAGRWVLLSVPCGDLGIGRIKGNQCQQVLPLLSAGIAVELYPFEARKNNLTLWFHLAATRGQVREGKLRHGKGIRNISHPYSREHFSAATRSHSPAPLAAAPDRGVTAHAKADAADAAGLRRGAAFLALLALLPPQLLPARVGPRGTQHSLCPDKRGLWAHNGSEHRPWHPNPFSRGSQVHC